MKILIYTLPFKENFGGILQAFALQEELKEEGHQVTFLNRRQERKPRILEQTVWLKWNLSERIIGKCGIMSYMPFFGVLPFKNRYLNVSQIFFQRDKIIEFCKKMNFEGYIVGSDQIWRYDFVPDIRDSFLYFAKDMDAVKLSYAASFGSDEWNYPAEYQKICAQLIQQFALVTVREDSGVELCRKHLGCEAFSVLDPTLLLRKEQYEKVIEENDTHKSKGIFCYMLDNTPYKEKIVTTIKESLGLSEFRMSCSHSLVEFIRNFRNGIKQTVPQWLSNFSNADFVITDSFHGTVFSIIFNKPFVTIANKERGMARFCSLLSKFGLQDRLLTESGFSHLEKILKEPVDWDSVNSKREELAAYSKQLLFSSLNINE